MTPPTVELRGITKRFGDLIANDGIDFTLAQGEIHALLGENGAGKTTLMNILCGLYEPDAGEIWLNGKGVKFPSPREAIASGISMVHQHFMLVDSFTVADNIVLGQSQQLWREDVQQLHQRLTQLAQQHGLQIDPATPVWQLSVGQQQRVEILKAIYRRTNVLILDEPTAVLTPQEVDDLLQTLKSLAAQGTSMIFITHKIREVLAVCDRVTVLRDGQKIDTLPTSATNERKLAQMMVGREVRSWHNGTAKEELQTANTPLLTIENLWVDNERGLPALRGVNLTACSGEIVGIAGVDGNGQRELEEAIAGLRPSTQGQLEIAGKLAHIPSDRYTMGLIQDFAVADNMVLRDINRPPFTTKGLLQPPKILRHALALIQQFLIRTPSAKTAAGKLSGGNAQRVVLARELSREPQLILAAQPTRGLDIGAVADVHRQLRERRDAGAAILVISTELDEIMSLSDRVAVLYEGKIVGIVNATAADVRQLGLMMGGGDAATATRN
ncbi:MAG: ABC transporter ATP-binding protein [Cyanophyceae cyanobacterium]